MKKIFLYYILIFKRCISARNKLAKNFSIKQIYIREEKNFINNTLNLSAVFCYFKTHIMIRISLYLISSYVIILHNYILQVQNLTKLIMDFKERRIIVNN